MVDFVLIFLLKVYVRPALERVLLLKTIRSIKTSIQDVSFTGARSTETLSHRRPASAETSRDAFGTDDTTDDTPCMCQFNVAASLSTCLK
jgi:hypothetical protein